MTDNVFESYIADEDFRICVIDKVYSDYKHCVKDGFNISKEHIKDVLIEYFDDFEFVIDMYLNEEFNG